MAVDRAARLVPSIQAEAPEVDVEGGCPVGSLILLREHGLLAAPVPERFGGASLSDPRCRLQLLHVLAHMGRGSLPVGRLYEGHVNALGLVECFATPVQAAQWFADARDGHLFGVWNTQGADGLTMTAGAPGRMQLNGCKTFASGAGVVTRALVTAQDAQGGWQMAIVHMEPARVTIDRSFWRPLGMHASASYKVDFGAVAVADDDLIGRSGDYYREPAFGGGAVRFAAVQQGGVEAIFDETRRFLRAAGRTIDPHQRARVGEMAVLVASGRQWLLGAARQALAHAGARGIAGEDAPAGRQQPPDEREPGAGHGAHANDRVSAQVRRTVAYAHLMRTAIESNALRVLQLAERCVGARGLMRPEPFERLHRDLTHYLRQAAPDAAVVAAGEFALASPEAAHALWAE
jgi:alkylation response protein AidB-like acyl-CoA dehydrogenase